MMVDDIINVTAIRRIPHWGGIWTPRSALPRVQFIHSRFLKAVG